MKKLKLIFIGILILIIIILFSAFQYAVLLKRQNDLLIDNVESIKKQIVSFEFRNSERWNARITELTKDNKELKNKIAVLEAILAQEAIKSASGKVKEAPQGNKGFLFKKR
jgi:hypothetical protein